MPGIFLGVLMFFTGTDPPRVLNKGNEKDFHHGHATSTCPSIEKTKKLHVTLQEQEEFDDNEEDVIEYESNEAQVLIESPNHVERLPPSMKNIPFSLWKCFFEPSVLLVGIGACIRQAGTQI
jgi:hypothetical protein